MNIYDNGKLEDALIRIRNSFLGKDEPLNKTKIIRTMAIIMIKGIEQNGASGIKALFQRYYKIGGM